MICLEAVSMKGRLLFHMKLGFAKMPRNFSKYFPGKPNTITGGCCTWTRNISENFISLQVYMLMAKLEELRFFRHDAKFLLSRCVFYLKCWKCCGA